MLEKNRKYLKQLRLMQANIYSDEKINPVWRTKVDIEYMKTEYDIMVMELQLRAEHAEDRLNSVVSFFFSEYPRSKKRVIELGLDGCKEKYLIRNNR